MTVGYASGGGKENSFQFLLDVTGMPEGEIKCYTEKQHSGPGYT